MKLACLEMLARRAFVSDRNVELHRRLVEPYNGPHADVEAFIALCDRQIEFHSTFAAVGGGVYHGHDGLRRMFRDLNDAWGDEFHIEPEAYFDLGECTIALNVLRARGQHSGAEISLPNASVARWRNDLCVYFKAYARREDAFRDLGVSADKLDPIAP